MARVIDWEAIEREYRIGQMSLRSLAGKYGITAAAISKKASAKGWVKDATVEVRERTRAALLMQLEAVDRGEVDKVNAVNNPTPADIQVAVETNVAVVTRHRKDIRYGHELASLLMGQLREAAQSRHELEEAIEVETASDEGTRRRASMLKAISLPQHAATLRDLSTAMKNFIPLERQAYNLDETSTEETYEQRLKRLMAESGSL